MKILHVNHLLDPVSGGGTAERTFQLARFLAREVEESAILTLDIGNIDACEKKLPSITVYKLPCINHRYFVLLAWPHRIKRIVSGFDIVHLMGHWTLLNAMVALVCLRQHKPYVVCPAGALKLFGRSRLLKRIYDFVIGRHIIRSASGLVAITEEEKQDFAKYGIAPESVVLIPNGVDPDDYKISNAYLSQPAPWKPTYLGDNPYVLFIGRLNEIKGPDLLLEAFAAVSERFPDLHLVFGGPDSGLLSSLRTRTEQLDLEQRVHFVGYLGGEGKVDVLRNALCLVIPSREEAMSMVVLEAGICGTPVIFTNRCGLDDFNHAGAGIMVEPSVESIRDGLLRALAEPEALRISGSRLREMVTERFLWSTQVKHYLMLYQRIFGI